MNRVAIVTDSTTNIPVELARNYSMEIIPLQVIWDQKVFRDGIDIQPQEFYQRLAGSPTMPTTSQATPANFLEVYGRLLDQKFDIFSIHISSRLSGTIDSAIQAQTHFPGANIEVFDSLSAGMALGFQALALARAAREGASLVDLNHLAQKAKGKTGIFFLVNTLEYLRRGGRIGGAAALIGSALHLKPILELRDGRIEAADKVRTFNKAMDRLLDLLEATVGTARPIRLSAQHANAPEMAAQMLEKARQRFSLTDVDEAIITEISPALGVHTGPGALGLSFMAGM